MLFVDFPDRPATQSTADVFASHVPAAEKWYAAVSYGAVTLQVTPVNTWFRMSRPSTDYVTRATASFERHRELMQEAVSAADPDHRLLRVPASLRRHAGRKRRRLLPPPSRRPRRPSASRPTGTRSGTARCSAATSTSPTITARTSSSTTGHAFGLPDLYDFDQTVFPYSDFLGDWDIMGGVDGGAGFVAWQRLQLGWIGQSQIACLAAAGTQDVQLAPIEQARGTKAVVVQTGPTSFTVARTARRSAKTRRAATAGCSSTRWTRPPRAGMDRSASVRPPPTTAGSRCSSAARSTRPRSRPAARRSPATAESR